MAGLTCNVVGQYRIRARLQQIEEGMAAAIAAVIIAHAAKIESAAKRRCTPPPTVHRFTLPPYTTTTDKMKNMIVTRLEESGLKAIIHSQHPASIFLEFGTGERGANAPHPKINGKEPTYTLSWKRGMYAQPFMVPSLEEDRVDFLNDVKAAIRAVGRRTT